MNIQWDTNIFMFLTRSEARNTYPHISSPNFLSPIFQSCSFQVPNHPVKSLATAHELAYNRTSSHSSFPRKVNHEAHCSKFCPLGGFLFTTPHQGCPREELFPTLWHTRILPIRILPLHRVVATSCSLEPIGIILSV